MPSNGIPALWLSTAYTFIVIIVFVVQLYHAYTKMRLICLIALIFTLGLSIIAALSTYYPSSFTWDCINTFLFGIFTVIFFELIISIFLEIGWDFEHYTPDQRRSKLFWIVVILAVSFAMIGLPSGFLVIYATDENSGAYFVIASLTAITGFSGMIGAVVYALRPLVLNVRLPSSSAIGVWYLLLIIPLSICYLIFYIIIFALAAVNIIQDISPPVQGIDFFFRSTLCLAYGLPPNYNVVRYIRKRFYNIEPVKEISITALQSITSSSSPFIPA